VSEENNNGLYTKVALLMDRESSNFEDIMHKLRNIEQSNKFMYDEIKAIQTRIKYIIMGVLAGFALINTDGLDDFIKSLM